MGQFCFWFIPWPKALCRILANETRPTACLVPSELWLEPATLGKRPPYNYYWFLVQCSRTTMEPLPPGRISTGEAWKDRNNNTMKISQSRNQTSQNFIPVFSIFSLCCSQIPCVFPVWKNWHPNSLFSLCCGHPDGLNLKIYQTRSSRGRPLSKNISGCRSWGGPMTAQTITTAATDRITMSAIPASAGTHTTPSTNNGISYKQATTPQTACRNLQADQHGCPVVSQHTCVVVIHTRAKWTIHGNASMM